MTGAIVFLVGAFLFWPTFYAVITGYDAKGLYEETSVFLALWVGLIAMFVGSAMILWATTRGQLC